MPHPPEAERFYTLEGYRRKNEPAVSCAMEDYLEMICRAAEADGCAHIGTLASRLNVRPSSASKMVRNLKALGLVRFEKYTVVIPTERGWELGNYLLWRHGVLTRFFCALTGKEEALEQTEKVEHFLSEQSVRAIERLLPLLDPP
ncbi:MAG: metal-dependent transcriptional regulator [Oscillospiraceae bacterium]